MLFFCSRPEKDSCHRCVAGTSSYGLVAQFTAVDTIGVHGRNACCPLPQSPYPVRLILHATRAFAQMKLQSLEQLLEGGEGGLMDEAKLRGITSTGVPDQGGLRPVLWRVLLRYAT